MKAVFKKAGHWFLAKITEEEPHPAKFMTGDQMDWPAFDLAMKNYGLELITAKRHAIKIQNMWLLNATFPGTKEGEIIPVEIDHSVMVRKIVRLEPNKHNSTTNEGGKHVNEKRSSARRSRNG